MTAPRTGSRYEMQVDRAGVEESKVERDYYAIHAADVEEIAEEDDLVGYVHSYEVGSTVDGPGLRFVAFLTGCLLRCQYCHNPDTWHKRNGHPVTVSRAMDADRQVRQGAEDQPRAGSPCRAASRWCSGRSWRGSSAAARSSGCTPAWTPPAGWARR